ncbi:MAG: metallo-beta-lactamase family protein [Clostridiales bacterium]|jgi:metallo-beta-lactamase family protein|nr:metallo-beta-lactamase family protein [Clostridiales bacterium]MDN5297746.1 metallo-beta-lactamase family protein [Clostridiales bacterium]
MTITFIGATGRVTGSMYYLEHNNLKGLVDCGQFQGNFEEENLNYSTLPFNPAHLDFIILTHAHVDHSGRLPLLVKHGFNGKVFCTYPTMALTNVLLRDSGKIHEAENALDNKKRERAGLPKVPPLYTEDDAVIALQYLYPLTYAQEMTIGDNFSFHFVDAGHLLGSASAILTFKHEDRFKKIVFSGDLGNGTNPVQNAPVTISEADYLIVESTYGDREHVGVDQRMHTFVDIIRTAVRENGTVIVPSFAVGRTQELIYQLNTFIDSADEETRQLLENIPFYVDSPLALDAFKVYGDNIDYMNEGVRNYDHDPFDMPNLHLVESIEMSIALNRDKSPKVIIAASGMCDAGRIKHHLKHYLWRQNTHVVFIGFQAEETLGRAIQDGESPVSILDETIAVKAKLHTITGFSGHADQRHLLAWTKSMQSLERLFIIHGEPAAMDVFAEKLSEQMPPETEIVIPGAGEAFELT